MKKTIYSFFALLMMATVFTSCQKEDSDDVNQDKIYTVYELYYNQNTDKTVAVCRLRFGSPTGTLLEATGAANVKYNGEVLPYSIIYSGHAKEYAGKLSGGTFTYTNTAGTTYTNSIPSMDTVGYQASFDTIVKSQANTFTWVGNALATNERMNLFVGSWTWGQDALFLAITPGQTNIVMGTNNLANLALGTSTCHIERVHELPVTSGTSEGGVVRAVYKPINKTVTVVP